MKCQTILRAVGSTIIVIGFCNNSYAVDSITPSEANAMIVEEIKTLISPELPKDKWISLSIVGGVASSNDQKIINHWANSCPEPSPYIASLNPVRPLSRIYSKIISQSVGPLKDETPEIIEAKKLVKTDAFDDYSKFEKSYNIAYAKYVSRTSDEDKISLLTEVELADRDWLLFGGKAEIGNAIALLKAHRELETINGRRLNVLSAYETQGFSDGKYVAGSFLAPPSEVSPPIADWPKEDGWVNLSFASKNTLEQTITKAKKKRGGGGFSLGFIKFGGTGGGTETETTKVNRVRSLNYSFSVKKVSIIRPWLDSEIFFEPRNWAWRRVGNTPNKPNVSIGLGSNGIPRKSPFSIYDDTNIGCSMLPTDFILAKNIKIEATVSEDDFREFEKSQSVAGGAILFSFIGARGNSSTSFKDVKKEGDAVSFTIEAKGISVIGTISHILPKLPNPNLANQWPDTAWID